MTTNSAAKGGTAQATRTTTVKHGKALIKLTCTGQGPCKGSLKLIARVLQKRSPKGHGKHHPRKHVRNIVIYRELLARRGQQRDPPRASERERQGAA